MPLLTLTTDIGLNDYLPGAIKGQFLTANPALNIVDITHGLSLFNYPQAAYVCSNAFKHFPEGTYNIVLVNLFETLPKHALIALHNGQYILCPDNGILTMITGAKPEKIVSVPVNTSKGFSTLQYTQTLANTIAFLCGGKTMEEVGTPVTDIEEKYPLRATYGSDWIEGQIIFIDNFENVVVNITREEFEEQRKGRQFKIIFTRNEIINSLSENYASVSAGEKLAWFNAAGYLEIAVNKGNMAGLFGMQGYIDGGASGAAIQNKWLYQTVRIFFE